MCIIIYRPKQHQLTEDILRLAAEQNHDGWGLMYATDGRVCVANGLLYEQFMAAYHAVPNDQEMAIHFLWRTHGDVDNANTHPYRVLSRKDGGADLWVMHNGVIPIEQVDPHLSDTWHWVNLKVAPLLSGRSELLKLPAFQDLLEDGIAGSRILFLDGTGRFTFLNRGAWMERDGCLYSSPPNAALSFIYRGSRALDAWDLGIGDCSLGYGGWEGEQIEEVDLACRIAVSEDGRLEKDAFRGASNDEICEIMDNDPDLVADWIEHYHT